MGSLILCIETSALPFSVALAREGKCIIEKTSGPDSRLARDITVFISEISAAAQVPLAELSAIAISAGPGSYTGLRIGMSVAKGLCFGLHIPLIALPTTLALAAAAREKHTQAADESLYLAMIDARRQEVYAEGFDGSLISTFELQPLIFPEQVDQLNPWKKKHIMISGDGAAKMLPYLSAFQATDIKHHQSASDLALPAQQAFTTGAFADLDTVAPIYCKAPNITTSKKLDKLFGSR